MTDPHRRARARRQFVALAAAGVAGGTLAPLLGALPAGAAPCRLAFEASARADLVRLMLLDLRPLGVSGPVPGSPLAGVDVASASVSASGVTPRSAASARYLRVRTGEQRLLSGASGASGASDASGALAAAASQQAPPHHDAPDTVAPRRLDAPSLRVGPGRLRAHARWQPGFACGRTFGTVSESSGSVLDASVGGDLARFRRNMSGHARTELVALAGGPGVASTAAVGAVDAVLSDGTRISVVEPPTLRVVAAGSRSRSSVDYDAPVLDVVRPDGTRRRLSSPAQRYRFDIKPVATESSSGGTGGGVGAPAARQPLSVVLSLGSVTSSVTDASVRAEATSARMHVLLGATTIADVGFGLLTAQASAPFRRQPVAPVAAPVAADLGPSPARLPRTGSRLLALVAGGLLLLLIGRWLMVLSRFR